MRQNAKTLPGLVVHADWGSAPGKRWMTVAELQGPRYTVDVPESVGELSTFFRRLLERAGGARVVVGFDFPIGLPVAYAQRAGIGSFLEALPQFGSGVWARFYDVAEKAEDISIYRPFYPLRPGSTEHAHLLRGVGVDSIDRLRRRCERSRPDRKAASPLFWTLGANQVGRAAIIGWRDVLAPAARNNEPDVAFWPFQGELPQLIEDHACVVAETYPAEACLHLGLTPPGRGWKKGRQKDRAHHASTLLEWVGRRSIWLSPTAEMLLRDGFGPSADGEDRFDSFVGLASMLEVLLGKRPDGAPKDMMVQRIEGWILGQDNGAESEDEHSRPGKASRRDKSQFSVVTRLESCVATRADRQ